MLALVFAWRCSTLVFVVQPCQLFLSWSYVNSCICIEASPLLWLLKQYFHLPFLKKHFQHKATSTLHLHLSHTNIHLCHGATSTLYLHWSRANIRLCHDIASTFHLHWSHTNIGLYNGVALAPIFRGNKVQTLRVPSTVARHQDFRDANKTFEDARRSYQDFEDAKRFWQNLEDVRRMPPRLWHCMNMPLEERWCNTNFRC